MQSGISGKSLHPPAPAPLPRNHRQHQANPPSPSLPPLLASHELLSKFTELLSTPAHFGLLATIQNESLEPLELLTPSSSTSGDASSGFNANLSTLLAPHLKQNEALYILLRRFPSPPAFLAITYIPDSSPVRQKMLFASTRLSLVRELGTEHFRETIVANSASELSPDGFKKHDAHSAMEAPLTEEERELGAVKKAEAEAGRGSGRKEINLSSHMSMPISEDALAALKEFGGAGEGGGRDIVMMKINPETETVILAPDFSASAAPSDIPSLVSAISPSEPRFTFFRYHHAHNGSESSPILFFYTCPTNEGSNRPSIKNRMMYPLMKRAVITMAEQECGVKADKKFEVDDPSDLTEETVLDDLHPKVAARAGFARPKRPGR
ncbi:hypothetical protein MKZ38_002766 [Zalerion maritima]|uniref:ADF-H domain-containing protein n=1 Tax=Zalerion maritima TaxID=339359 RepID=A0AAD5RPS1_9PEZI|nr:hypothetical protein MKZ38_002766 [Zalerion maritima]